MFRKKTCPNCKEKVKDDWTFCPYCGEELKSEKSKEREFIISFKSVFDEIDKEFEKIDKMFGFDSFKFPSVKARPGIKGGSISIVVQSGTGMEPRIEIKTSGDYKKIEPELKRKLGVKPSIEEVEESRDEREKERKDVIPKVAEEPETEIKNLGKKQIISIKLPGVKSEDDIEIKKLEQSIEVKAFSKDKVYFKLIPIPKYADITKEFKEGVLKIEIER